MHFLGRRLFSSGYSLLELMVGVAIIGILATIAGQSYKGFQIRAKRLEVVMMASTFHKFYETYKIERGSFPTTDMWLITSDETTTRGCYLNNPFNFTTAQHCRGLRYNYSYLILGGEPILDINEKVDINSQRTVFLGCTSAIDHWHFYLETRFMHHFYDPLPSCL